MLTLIVPGLIWPHQALVDLTSGLVENHHALPAFATLLGRGRLTRWPARSTQDWLAHQLGLPCPLPAAALRGLALGSDMADHHWLCLDPVHLRFESTRLIVDDPQNLVLNSVEAAQLAVSLAPTFAPFGELQMLTPQAWQLRLTPGSLPPPTSPLPDIIARAAQPLPSGADWAAWRQAINEAQMVLHTHPVNQAREAAGQPTVNSLWPWGAGALPTDTHRPAAPAPSPQPSPPNSGEREFHASVLDQPAPQNAALWSSDLIIQGAAQLLNMKTAALPESGFKPARFEQPNTKANMATIAIIDILEHPARTGDAHPWREQLLRLESDWLAPIHAALRRGQLDHLRLIAPGESVSFELDFHRRDAWKFWRKPAAFTVLAAA